MLPVTKSQPKEMLPLIDRPVIQYSVEEAVDSGITDIIIVTSIGKRAVEDYFDRSLDIEQYLRNKGDEARYQEVRRIPDLANFAYVRQGEMGGIGHAVLTVRHLIDDDEPFVVFLPDDVIVNPKPATQQLIDCYDKHGGSVVAVEEVPRQMTSNYGIVAGEPVDERTLRLRQLIEKPAPEVAPSNLAIVGRYLFTPAVFGAIENTPRGYGGEMQITDAMQTLTDGEGMYSYRFDGDRFDTGRPVSYIMANVAMGLRREDTAPELRHYLRSLSFNES
jgi:UTP--glucose-1-phosphate uridylyltransferase